MTLYTHADSNIRKTWLYVTFFFLFIIALGSVWRHQILRGVPFLRWFVHDVPYIQCGFSGLRELGLDCSSWWDSDYRFAAVRK